MKKFILTPCFILLAALCFAQQTVPVTKDSLIYRLKYNVLKSNNEIRQGKYSLSVIKSGKILTTGSYKNNLKDGSWHEYDDNGYTIVEGKYKDGQRVGVWSYYGAMWEELNKYDFTKHQLIFHKGVHQDSIITYKVLKGTDTIDTKMDRPPIYLSGNGMILRNLFYNLHYPPEAVAKGVYGRVIIAFTIDENGHVRDYKVVQGLGSGLDEEALRVIKLLPNDWVPGILDGKPVAVVLQQPVGFKIQD